MAIALYELTGAEDDRQFSPYCWRIRMALAHKGLKIETRPWRFTEKSAIAFAGTDKVPVLVDGDRTLHDSPAIADWLDEAYADRPPLFAGPDAKALTRFVIAWNDTVVQPGLFRLVLKDIHDHLAEKDKAYFRESREARVGMTMEAFVADREQRLPAFRQSLQPLRLMLKAQPFICGAAPAYADYAVFAAFQWARCISPFRILERDDPVAAWCGRLLAAFGGVAGAAKGYDTLAP